MSVLCCIMCVRITECAMHTAPLISEKCFLTKTHFIRYILKVLQKTSEVFLSFSFFLNMVTSAAVRASITTNMSNE